MPERRHHHLLEAQRDRDDALRRLGRVRGMTIVGAGALTAAAAAAVAAAVPGRTVGATTTPRLGQSPATATSAARSRPLRMPPPAGAARLGLGSSGEDGAPASSPPSQPAPQPSQPAPPTTQSAPAPQPAPAAPQPAPSSGGGGVVSGGS